MPGQTALDIFKKFKEVVRDVPVILITTLEDSGTQELAVNLGAVAVFDKPFNVEMLKEYLLGKVPLLTPVRTRETKRENGLGTDLFPGPDIV
jgi:DNA-binding NtrC family response regulator